MLRDWRPATPEQDALRHSFLAFLSARPDACERACVPGHLTASTLLLDHSGEHMLLTLHRRIGRWVQLGGHCESGDGSLAGAALREAVEESGITDPVVDPTPVHLDVHPVTCSLGVPTRHFDVRFRAHARPGAEPATSDESLDLRWWPVREPPDGADDLTPLITAALR
ncbi:NUDIX hydrolase [Haloechinothrix alba]|nr:NUDIX domain-containing protein [Haloechinothrix alba]